MKRIILTIAIMAASVAAFAQVETSGLDYDKNKAFMEERLYKLPEFSKGTVIFDQDAAVYDDEGIPITLHPSQGIINIDNLHQCVMMINGKDTIPIIYEEHVAKVNTGKHVYLKIKGIYYEIVEFNDSVLGFMQVLTATDMGRRDTYGTNSQLSAVTNISSLAGEGAGVTNLEANTDVRYSYEQRPVFIHGKKVAYLNEKQLCKMYKKKSAVIKEFFANNDVDQFNLEQARELYKLILQ